MRSSDEHSYRESRLDLDAGFYPLTHDWLGNLSLEPDDCLRPHLSKTNLLALGDRIQAGAPQQSRGPTRRLDLNSTSKRSNRISSLAPSIVYLFPFEPAFLYFLHDIYLRPLLCVVSFSLSLLESDFTTTHSKQTLMPRRPPTTPRRNTVRPTSPEHHTPRRAQQLFHASARKVNTTEKSKAYADPRSITPLADSFKGVDSVSTIL